MVARNMLWVFFSCLGTLLFLSGYSSFLPLMFFFSCLDTRKEAKEDQGVRDAGQVGRVPVKLPCLGRGRQGRRPSRAGYLSNFVVGRSRPLIQEKKQKKIKASTEAGEVGRVHDKSNRLPANWAAYLSHLVGGSDAALAEEFVEIGDGLL